MKLTVEIEPEMLEWAVRKTGKSIEELTEIADFKNLPLWIERKKKPTLRQAELLAQKAGIPFPLLLLDEPYEEKLSLPDFRTIGGSGVKNPSPELERVIKDCRSRLDWYKEYANDAGVERLPKIGTYTDGDDPEAAALELSSEIAWKPGQESMRDRAVAKLSEDIESLGILVMRSALVGNNTSRPLDVKEFRGFTLIEDGFALIFVNARDAKSAQLFSLAHELGHVLLGKPGISGDYFQGTGRTEQWCNQFAAEFLVPQEYIKTNWTDSHRIADLQDSVHRISIRLGVSPEVAIWRAADLSLLPSGLAQPLIDLCSYKGPKKTRQGGDGIANMRPRIGNRFLSAAARAIGTDLLSITDAGYYLGVKKSDTIEKLLSKVGNPL